MVAGKFSSTCIKFFWFLFAAVLGKVLGNRANKEAKIKITIPKIIHPSHQAPNHLGSLFPIFGVRVGDIGNFKQNDAMV